MNCVAEILQRVPVPIEALRCRFRDAWLLVGAIPASLVGFSAQPSRRSRDSGS